MHDERTACRTLPAPDHGRARPGRRRFHMIGLPGVENGVDGLLVVEIAVAAIHDVSPRFETEVAALTDMLAQHVGNCVAMLVVPNHWGDAPIIPGSPFAIRLRAWADQGVEMFLHGFFHYDDTSYDAAADR